MIVQKNTLILAIWTISALGIAGCQSDPFPKDEGTLSERKAEPPRAVAPPFSLDVPAVMEFEEGKESEYKILGMVNGASGGATIAVYELPKGATFSPADSKIKWTPDFNAGGDASSPNTLYRQYSIRVMLWKQGDSLTSIERRVQLLVKDVPREFTVQPAAVASSLPEGKEILQTIHVQSDDFPKGPFVVSSANMPAGAVIERDTSDPARFMIRYTPSFNSVTVDNEVWGSTEITKDVSFDLEVAGPKGVQSMSKIDWKLKDVRQQPQVMAPENLTLGFDSTFTLQADDLNGETEPSITLEKTPSYGQISVQGVNTLAGLNQKNFNSYTVQVRWSEIPAEKMGTSDFLEFKICVFQSRYEKELCTHKTVNVEFAHVSGQMPVIDRSSWGMSEMKFVRVGKVEEIEVPVSEGSVKILPESIAHEVQWNDGVLTLNAASPGIKQFTVQATGRTGSVQAESFVFEALPASWSKTLILGEGLRNPEIATLLRAIPGAGVANPEIQELTAKMFALRETLIISTSGLQAPEQMAAIEEGAMSVKNVIITTPLWGTLSGRLAQEISQRGIRAQGRFADITGGSVSIGQYQIKPTTVSALSGSSSTIVRLTGKATSESASPLLMSVGVPVLGSPACSTLLNLEKQTGGASFQIAAECSRESGGKLIVSGFEWGDLDDSNPNVDVAVQWMKELL